MEYGTNREYLPLPIYAACVILSLMSNEPENLVLQLLREMRTEMKDMKLELKEDIHSLRADVASDIHSLDAKIDASRKSVSEQIVGLRRAVVDYHSSVIGHGIIISELEARVRRVEQHLDLPSMDAH